MNKIIEKIQAEVFVPVKCLLLVRGVASSDSCFVQPHDSCLGQARDGAKCPLFSVSWLVIVLNLNVFQCSLPLGAQCLCSLESALM